MFNVFNQVPLVTGTTFNYQGFDYISSQIKKNLSNAMYYYRVNFFGVRSDHILLRILDMFSDVDPNVDDIDYLEQVVDKYLGSTTMLGLTTPFMKSKPNHRGHFFGENGTEIYIGSDDISFYSGDWEDKWRDASPVRTLHTPRSDLLPVRPGLDFKSSESGGLSTLEINVPMLMLQFKYWYNSFESKYENGVLDNQHFVSKYPLVNMMPGVVDVAIFNIAYNLLKGVPEAVVITNVPFMTLSNEVRVRRLFKVAYGKLRTTMMTPEAILLNTPAIYKPSAFHLQVFNDKVTMQNTWAYVAAKMHYIAYVLEFLDYVPYGDARGVKLRIALKRSVNQMLGNKLLRNGIDKRVSDYLYEFIYTNIVSKL